MHEVTEALSDFIMISFVHCMAFAITALSNNVLPSEVEFPIENEDLRMKLNCIPNGFPLL